MRRFWWGAIFLVLGNVAQAESSWQAVVQLAETKGIRDEFSPGQEFRHLDRLEPDDRRVPHTAHFFTLKGYVAGGGAFLATSASGVSEDWKLDGDNGWKIEQWLFTANQENGLLLTTYHRLLLTTLDGAIRKILDLPTGPPEEQAKLWAAHWQSFLPPAAAAEADRCRNQKTR